MSDTGSIKIINEPSLRKNVKYTPLFKSRRGSDESKVTTSDFRPVSWSSRVRQLLGVLVLLLLFTISVLGSVVMWATDFYDAAVHERLILRNGSQAFEAWRKSPVKPIMRFRLFNYTNYAAFKAGEEPKLRVQEAGPYTFTEESERVNVTFKSDNTISYNDKKTYEFVPELSAGSLEDNIVSVNTLLLSITYKYRRATLIERIIPSGTLRVLQPEPLHVKTAREIFWGYQNSLTKFVSLKEKDLRVGILQQKSGVSSDNVTVYSGEDDLRRLGQIELFNQKAFVNYYGTDECNRVDGSDGTKFPPPLVRRNNTLYIYHRDVCRRVPLEYVKDVMVWDRVPALRFRPPSNVLDDGDSNPQNACYCLPDAYDACQPSGVMDVSHCKKNAPIFASFPHFYLGDPILLDAVDGLKPDPVKHDMYLDIHQMGVPIAGRTRFQFNALVKNPFSMSLLTELNEKLLPILWMERDLGEFPPELQDLFYTASYTVPRVKMALSYGCLGVAVVTGAALLLWIMSALHSLLKGPMQTPEMYVMTRL